MLGEDPGDDAEQDDRPPGLPQQARRARMAIISAGVIMNLIFGLICATWIHMRGGREIPAVVGAVVAGQPAYQAGIRPGDEIVAIDGRGDVSYQNLLQAVLLSGAGHQVKFDIKRPGQAGLIRLGIEPKRAANAQTPTIGILPAQSLDLFPRPPKGADEDEEPKTRDRALAASAAGAPIQPVPDVRALNALLARYRDKTIHLVTERRSLEEAEKPPKSTVEVDVPPKPFLDLGIRMTMGPVAAIRPDSPARRPDSRSAIASSPSTARPTSTRCGSPTSSTPGRARTRRSRSSGPRTGRPRPTVPLTRRPDATPPWTEPTETVEPQEIPGLGLAVAIEPKVAAVDSRLTGREGEGRAGDVVKSVRFLEPKTGWTSQRRKIEESLPARRKAARPGRQGGVVALGLRRDPGLRRPDPARSGHARAWSCSRPSRSPIGSTPSHGLRFGPLTRPCRPSLWGSPSSAAGVTRPRWRSRSSASSAACSSAASAPRRLEARSRSRRLPSPPPRGAVWGHSSRSSVC